MASSKCQLKSPSGIKLKRHSQVTTGAASRPSDRLWTEMIFKSVRLRFRNEMGSKRASHGAVQRAGAACALTRLSVYIFFNSLQRLLILFSALKKVIATREGHCNSGHCDSESLQSVRSLTAEFCDYHEPVIACCLLAAEDTPVLQNMSSIDRL